MATARLLLQDHEEIDQSQLKKTFKFQQKERVYLMPLPEYYHERNAAKTQDEDNVNRRKNPKKLKRIQRNGKKNIY